MKNLCKPYKDFNLAQITQTWSTQHQAFDLAGKYGTFLVAMENCVVENIMGVETLGDNGWEYERGFGILLKSIANPEIKYSYWHCLPIFPVKIGDTIMQGQIVAQMGNSGYCMSNGVVVPYKDKLKPPYPGTHCHFSCPQNTMDRIDWSIPIKYDVLITISLFLKNMMNFLIK